MTPHELVTHTKRKRHDKHGFFTVYDIDTEKSTWFGDAVNTLGAYGRERFENWVVLTRPKERIKIIYH